MCVENSGCCGLVRAQNYGLWFARGLPVSGDTWGTQALLNPVLNLLNSANCELVSLGRNLQWCRGYFTSISTCLYIFLYRYKIFKYILKCIFFYIYKKTMQTHFCSSTEETSCPRVLLPGAGPFSNSLIPNFPSSFSLCSPSSQSFFQA